MEPFAEVHEVEKVCFHDLIDLLHLRYADAEPALMRAQLDGRDVAVIVAVVRENAEQISTTPLAVLVDGLLFEALTPPGDPEIVRAG